MLRSRSGSALTAIRDNERGAERLGVDVFRTKLVVYVVAAFGSGVAGALVYLNLLRISPDAAFSVNWTAFDDLHRGDRRHRHASRARSSAPLLFFVLRETSPTTGRGT